MHRYVEKGGAKGHLIITVGHSSRTRTWSLLAGEHRQPGVSMGSCAEVGSMLYWKGNRVVAQCKEYLH